MHTLRTRALPIAALLMVACSGQEGPVGPPVGDLKPSFVVGEDEDTEPPVAIGPADVWAECAVNMPPSIDLTATDNVDGEITVSPTEQIIPGISPNDFVLIRTWTFTDQAGNSSSVSQVITVFDDTPPVPPAAPADVTVSSLDLVPPALDLSAVDNCDGTITVLPTDVITPGSSGGLVIVRTWAFTDQTGNTSSVSQIITVINNPPVAMNDVTSTDEDTPVAIDVLANDTDPEFDLLTVSGVTQPSNGTVTINPDNTVTYTPNPDFNGNDQFTYSATDPGNLSDQATVSITVDPVPDVVIEIKPEDDGDPNPINSKSNGLVAVAILGMPGEYALTDIDWTTLAFGPAGATAVHDLSDPEAWSDHVMDVNGNGAPDLVTHYHQKDTGLAPGDTEACLTGTVAGKAITACGPVTVR